MKVFVSGGTGFIAGELIEQLLARGHSVATTVRSLAKSEALLKERFADSHCNLTLHEADLNQEKGWSEAMDGCDAIAHVASPFPLLAPKDRDHVVRPAVEGTLRILRIANEKGIKRFVQTSSVAAIAYGQPGKEEYDHTDWTDPNADISAYYESKTRAEMTAREWVSANAPEMTYCSINPFAVLGPVGNGSTSTSIEIIKRMIDGSVPLIPRMGLGIADVRDVARAHVLSLEAPSALIRDERFPVSSRFMWFEEMAEVIRSNVPEHAKKVPRWKMPDWLVHVSALFMPEMKQVRDELNQRRDVSGRHTQKVLSFQFRNPEETIADTVRSLVEKARSNKE